MSLTPEEAAKKLAQRGIPLVKVSFVVQEVVYVAASRVTNVEIFSFLTSFVLMISGVLLGVMYTPNNPYFFHFLIVGILLLIVGIVIFFIGVHREIKQWEKTKTPLKRGVGV